jgi:PBP1b-binding outer membrane lipoprotein LpoB
MKKVILFILFLLAIFYYGCSGSGADSTNYQDPNFSSYKIIKIAVLPIRNTYLNIGEANNINRYFITQLSRKTTIYTFVGPDESIDKMNKDSLVDIYYQHLVSYSTTGIPNRETIKKIGVSLNVDAIIQGEIFNISKVDGQYGVQKGKTKCQLRYSLLSASDGKVLWETTVESYKYTATTLESAPPLNEVIILGMDKILESIPQGK